MNYYDIDIAQKFHINIDKDTSAIVVYGSYTNYENNDTAIVALLDGEGKRYWYYYAQFQEFRSPGEEVVYVAVFHNVVADIVEVGLLATSALITTIHEPYIVTKKGHKVLEVRL